MRVVVEQNLVRNVVEVWILPNDGTQRSVVRLESEDGTARLDRLESLAPDGRPAPTLELSREAFAALVAEGADVLPPDRAQAKHLDDAVAVRDRLLAVVERSTLALLTETVSGAR